MPEIDSQELKKRNGTQQSMIFEGYGGENRHENVNFWIQVIAQIIYYTNDEI